MLVAVKLIWEPNCGEGEVRWDWKPVLCVHILEVKLSLCQSFQMGAVGDGVPPAASEEPHPWSGAPSRAVALGPCLAH